MTDVTALLDRVWRSDAAGMLGALTRRLGDLDRAEEALQEALAEALKRWADEGVPDNPAGWLVTTAWRKALDRLRRDATGRDKLASRPRRSRPRSWCRYRPWRSAWSGPNGTCATAACGSTCRSRGSTASG